MKGTMSRRKQCKPQHIASQSQDVDLLRVTRSYHLPTHLLQLKVITDDPLTTGIYNTQPLTKGTSFGPFFCQPLQTNCIENNKKRNKKRNAILEEDIKIEGIEDKLHGLNSSVKIYANDEPTGYKCDTDTAKSAGSIIEFNATTIIQNENLKKRKEFREETSSDKHILQFQSAAGKSRVQITSEAGYWLSLLTTTDDLSCSNIHIYLHAETIHCEVVGALSADTHLIAAMLLVQSRGLGAALAPYHNRRVSATLSSIDKGELYHLHGNALNNAATHNHHDNGTLLHNVPATYQLGYDWSSQNRLVTADRMSPNREAMSPELMMSSPRSPSVASVTSSEDQDYLDSDSQEVSDTETSLITEGKRNALAGLHGITEISNSSSCSKQLGADCRSQSSSPVDIVTSATGSELTGSPVRNHSPVITGAFKCASCPYTADKKSRLMEHMLDHQTEETAMEEEQTTTTDSEDHDVINTNNYHDDASMDANNDDELTTASKIEVEDTQEKEESMKTELSVSPRARNLSPDRSPRARNMSPDRSLSVSPVGADITIKEERSSPSNSAKLSPFRLSPAFVTQSKDEWFCEQCDIAFSSESTFAAHKQFYCGMRAKRLKTDTSSTDIAQAPDLKAAAASASLPPYTLIPITLPHTSPMMPTPMMTPFGLTYAVPYLMPIPTPASQAHLVREKKEVLQASVRSSVKRRQQHHLQQQQQQQEQQPLDLSCRKVTTGSEQKFRPSVSRCEECNIVFYKHENFMVHKEHYCAGRRGKVAPAVVCKKESVSPPASTPRKQMSPAVTPITPSCQSPVRDQSHLQRSPKSRLTSSPNKDVSGSPGSPGEEYTVQYFCLPCKIQFSSPDTLEAHQQYYCPARSLIAEQAAAALQAGLSPKVECPHCHAPFRSMEDLAKHMCTHTTMKIPMFCCPYCQYVAQSDSRLLDHIKSHAPTKAYRCTLCGYRGNTVRGMRMHGKTHLDIGENFTDDHMIEYEEPPLVPKRLRTVTENISIATNCNTPEEGMTSGERKRSRSGKLILGSDDVMMMTSMASTNHQQAGGSHVCLECNTIFSDTHKLRMHMISHLQEERLFKCKACNFITDAKANLVYHVKTMHEVVCLGGRNNNHVANGEHKDTVKNSDKYTIDNLINNTDDGNSSGANSEDNNNHIHRRSVSPVRENHSPQIIVVKPSSPTTIELRIDDQQNDEVFHKTDSGYRKIHRQRNQSQSSSQSPPILGKSSVSSASSSSASHSPISPTAPNLSTTSDADDDIHVPQFGDKVENGKLATNYCDQCDIKFVYMSTFLAHKKYYCSSHAGERKPISAEV